MARYMSGKHAATTADVMARDRFKVTELVFLKPLAESTGC